MLLPGVALLAALSALTRAALAALPVLPWVLRVLLSGLGAGLLFLLCHCAPPLVRPDSPAVAENTHAPCQRCGRSRREADRDDFAGFLPAAPAILQIAAAQTFAS